MKSSSLLQYDKPFVWCIFLRVINLNLWLCCSSKPYPKAHSREYFYSNTHMEVQLCIDFMLLAAATSIFTVNTLHF